MDALCAATGVGGRLSDNDNERIFFSPATVARLLDISQSAVYNLLDRGELRAIRIGRSRRVAREDLEAFVARCKQGEPE